VESGLRKCKPGVFNELDTGLRRCDGRNQRFSRLAAKILCLTGSLIRKKLYDNPVFCATWVGEGFLKLPAVVRKRLSNKLFGAAVT
jgi:hypothetical protein